MVAFTIRFHESAFGLIRNDHSHGHPSGSSFHASSSLPLASSHLSLCHGGSKIICASSSTIEDLHDSEEIGCCKSSRFLTSLECTKLCNLLASYLSCWHLQKSCFCCNIRKTVSDFFCSISFLSSKIWSWDHSFALLNNNLSSSSNVLSKIPSFAQCLYLLPSCLDTFFPNPPNLSPVRPTWTNWQHINSSWWIWLCHMPWIVLMSLEPFTEWVPARTDTTLDQDWRTEQLCMNVQRALSCHCRQQMWISTLLLSRGLHRLMQDSWAKCEEKLEEFKKDVC